MATTDVILTKKIKGLGVEADVITVKAGYARNYLIPQGLAYGATSANLRRLNQLQARRAEREAAELNDSQELARRIGKMKLQMTLETGESGKAFGSITSNDLAERMKTELGDPEFDRHRIQLEKPIKETGTHEVPVKLHADVVAKLTVVVKANAAVARVEEEEEDDSGDRRRNR